MLNVKDTQLALIHIPLRLYPSFVQPILQLLLPTHEAKDARPPSHGSGSSFQTKEHPFMNISVTPVECSIALPRAIAESLFVPARDALNPTDRDAVTIANDDYVVMQVDGEGLEAGQRVSRSSSLPPTSQIIYSSHCVRGPRSSQPWRRVDSLLSPQTRRTRAPCTPIVPLRRLRLKTFHFRVHHLRRPYPSYKRVHLLPLESTTLFQPSIKASG